MREITKKIYTEGLNISAVINHEINKLVPSVTSTGSYSDGSTIVNVSVIGNIVEPSLAYVFQTIYDGSPDTPEIVRYGDKIYKLLSRKSDSADKIAEIYYKTGI